ncbi:glutamate-5-semialdehyde dehydrogenase [Ruminococcaceae bacterium OttesenSCG-928-A16]|nr:glutamate-5-semialdehyde dehydrogenase [Ruminococcaceae bacterium OttesenSCG-928-A16]
MSIDAILAAAKAAKAVVAAYTEDERNAILESMATALTQNSNAILAANQQDIENATGRIADVMIDRLRLDQERIAAMAKGIRDVAALQSPLGHVENEFTNADGLKISKVRVPVGVVAIIYESRPNVTTDAAALCLKSGNVCILRGGSDAICTNTAIAQSLAAALAANGAPAGTVQLVTDTSHDSARLLMEARGSVDLLIPRGGKNLIRAVVEGAKGVPVIETGTGICHVYVDKDADLAMAANIVYNAKTSRPSVCNSAEVCLVHRDVAAAFLPEVQKLLHQKQVELRLDSRAAAIIDGSPATPDDFDTEFLDYILAIAVVDSLQDAIAHINQHSTGHSDAIITANPAAATAFLTQVDSAAVYHNASTRFTDGGVFGLGCEMGISTQKIGARGPMGLYELTSYKYTIQGTGQTR